MLRTSGVNLIHFRFDVARAFVRTPTFSVFGWRRRRPIAHRSCSLCSILFRSSATSIYCFPLPLTIFFFLGLCKVVNTHNFRLFSSFSLSCIFDRFELKTTKEKMSSDFVVWRQIIEYCLFRCQAKIFIHLMNDNSDMPR